MSWGGFFNARDLGGLPTVDGGTTQWARVYRSATLHLATPAGWEQAYAAGVRTVVSLLNDDEVPPAGAAAGDATERMTRVRVALDVVEDTELWNHIEADGIDGTPLYFVPLLERHPERLADAVRVIARAEPGGVLFHCGAGRDRTGLVAVLLLSLAGGRDTPEGMSRTPWVEPRYVQPRCPLGVVLQRLTVDATSHDDLLTRLHAAQTGFRDEGLSLRLPALADPDRVAALGPRLDPAAIARLRRFACPTRAAALMLALVTDANSHQLTAASAF